VRIAQGIRFGASVSLRHADPPPSLACGHDRPSAGRG
jgi:hypothetical protein